MKRFIFLLAGLIAAALFLAVMIGRYRTGEAAPQVRAIWVTRYDYHSAEDVRAIVTNLGVAGFTDVFFQIRGNGSVFYRSEVEPWAYELSDGRVSSLGRDPGWDPLQLALDTAAPFGMRVHAYLNVLPGWKGLEDPPATAKQLWLEHPDWFMVDSFGVTMRPTMGWYAFLNPVLPEVRQHLCDVVAELCRYDVAGIHLDYIRYPHDYRMVAKQHYPDATDEELRRHSDFSYDPVSQAELLARYGKDVSKEEITAFRCASVTRVVEEISCTLQELRPDSCILSASVMGNPVEGKHVAYQDSASWARRGLLDWVVQMNYATRSFESQLRAMRKAAGRRRFRSSVVVGIYCKHDVALLSRQLERIKDSGCRGYSLFSYSYLFDEQHQPTKKGRQLLAQLRP